MRIKLVLIFTSVILLSSCSLLGSKKDSNKPITDGLSPKALYALSEDKVNDGSINKANEYLELIIAAYPGSKFAIQARLDIAYNLFKQKKYSRSILELDNFIDMFPALDSTPYAYYLRGVVAEEKSSSILDNFLTDSAQRDVQSVKDAYVYYNLLIDLFPESKYSDDAKKKLVILKNTLARHEFYVALYYTNNHSNIAAINRCKYIVENYPNSPVVADGLHLMAYNYDLINAEQLAIDARKVLSLSYPSYLPGYSVNK